MLCLGVFGNCDADKPDPAPLPSNQTTPANVVKSPDELDRLPVSIKNGTFYRDGKPVYYTGPFIAWHNPDQWIDRRGEWSQNRIYRDGLDRETMTEFGFNTWQPICLLSYFIMKKHYPDMLTKKWARPGTTDYFRDCEQLAKNLLRRVRSAPIIMDYSDIVDFERRLDQGVPPEQIQQNPWGRHFFPVEPANSAGFELYDTMFRDGTKFVLDNGGNPFIYELFNEPFYNGLCPENFIAWEKWLAEKYGNDIARANKTWGTAFPSFAAAVAELPKNLDDEAGPWVDWMDFISQTLAGHIRRWVETIRATDSRPTPKHFTWQPAPAVSSFRSNNAFNMTYCDFLDVMGTEYCTPVFGVDPGDVKSDNIMEIGFTSGNDSKFLAAKLCQAYARGRPIVDFEMHSSRIANGIRIPSQHADIETNLWFQVMNGFAGSVHYSWDGRNWEWKNLEEAKRSSLSAHYKHHAMLNPYNYPEDALFGLRRFREQIDRLAEIVLPRPRVEGSAVGVLYLDHQSWLLKGRERQGYEPWQKGLRTLHQPHDFIIAEYLRGADDLARYRALFCPVIEFCPASLRQILQDYVARGGILVAGPDAFSHTEYGQPAEAETLLGLRLIPAGKEQRAVDVVLARDGAELGSYQRANIATASGATPFATWKQTGDAAIYSYSVGRGKVYTLLFDRGAKTLQPAFRQILDMHGITPNDDLLLDPSGALDVVSTLDTIDRGDLRFHFIVNWAAMGHRSRLVMRGLAGRGWRIYDAVTGDTLTTPTGSATWTGAELAAGVPLFIPTQERVLILASRKAMPWASGKLLTSADLQARAETAIAADRAALEALAQESAAYNRNLEEQRLWREVSPENTFAVDLRQHVNMGFRDDKIGDQTGGWTDQGPLNDLRELPVGKQTFYGVPYDIIDPAANGGKSAIVLRGGDRQYFPAAATNIPVGLKAAALFFLHGSAWTAGTPLFHYTVHYADGATVDIPLLINEGCAEWWNPSDSNLVGRDLRVAWTVKNQSHLVGLFTYKWKNPRPDQTIVSIDVVSLGKALPLVVAITGLTCETAPRDPITEAEVLLGEKLRDGWQAVAWKHEKAQLLPGDDGWTVLTAQPQRGGWGGIRLTANDKNPAAPVKLGAGNWSLHYEINYDGRDPFGKIDANVSMQVSVRTEPAQAKNGAFSLQRVPMQRLVDKDAATWEVKTVPLGAGPLELREVSWQFHGENPPHGVKLRRVFFRQE
jgi:hypothetical protein